MGNQSSECGKREILTNPTKFTVKPVESCFTTSARGGTKSSCVTALCSLAPSLPIPKLQNVTQWYWTRLAPLKNCSKLKWNSARMPRISSESKLSKSRNKSSTNLRWSTWINSTKCKTRCLISPCDAKNSTRTCRVYRLKLKMTCETKKKLF